MKHRQHSENVIRDIQIMHVDTVQGIEQYGFLRQYRTFRLACRTGCIDQQQGCCEIDMRIAVYLTLRTACDRSDISVIADFGAGHRL
jgi:hypothetical protein